MNLEILEKNLKMRWQFPYKWGGKQNDADDQETKFIYTTRSFSELLRKTATLSPKIANYAMNRWYNFWSAQGVEFLFSQHKNVEPQKNSYDKLVDFSISGTSFDHKTTVFPKGFGKDYLYAKNNKKELIQRLYDEQSQQGRKHLKNRLFICMFDSKDGEHWKLKAELTLLGRLIDSYVENFDASQLERLDFGEGEVLADILWLEK